MIDFQTRKMQLLRERQTTKKLLRSSARILLRQLKKVEHPFVDAEIVRQIENDVLELIQMADNHEEFFDQGDRGPEHIYTALEQRKGIDKACNEFEKPIDAWHQKNEAKILELDRAEPTEQTIELRSICYQFISFYQLAQSLKETNHTLAGLHALPVMLDIKSKANANAKAKASKLH